MLAPANQNLRSAMSRNWQRVAKDIQKLAAGMYAVKSEGMFPYENSLRAGNRRRNRATPRAGNCNG